MKKLTKEDVKLIINKYKSEKVTQKQLASEFGVSQAIISRLTSGTDGRGAVVLAEGNNQLEGENSLEK